MSHTQDIPEEKQNDFKQAGDRYRKMSLREYVRQHSHHV